MDRARHGPSPPWQRSTAYRYLLALDPSSLAWEYLRRNPDYRRAWEAHLRGDDEAILAFGLRAAVEPSLAARKAQPEWCCAEHEQPQQPTHGARGAITLSLPIPVEHMLAIQA